jgi:diguanylate cyclase (GGDEF)-like protein
MSPDNPKRPSLTEIRNALEEVNQAILLHSKAMAAWSRNAICSLPFDERYLDTESYKSCDFGHWYYGNHLEILEGHPAFLATNEAHKAIHASLRQISIKLNRDERVTTEEADAFLDQEGEFLSALATLRDELFSLSYSYDYLTGTLNRQAFFQLLAREYARLLRSNDSCTLAITDLDLFKGVNDQYGHQAGDAVLQYVADFLNQCLRPYDLICRFGGEEFLLCLPHADVETAYNTIERLRKNLSEAEIPLPDGEKLHITASFGIAPLAVDTPWDVSIERADSALYQAKNEGRNRTVVWSE